MQCRHRLFPSCLIHGMAALVLLAFAGSTVAQGANRSTLTWFTDEPLAFVTSIQWQASPDQAPQPVCTGSVLSPVVVVTTAHCVAELVRSGDDGTRLHLVIGRDDLADVGAGIVRHPLRGADGRARVFLHPRYDGTPRGNRYDVAVIQLDAPAGVNLRPVLSAAPEHFDAPWTVAGWGMGSALRRASETYLRAAVHCSAHGDGDLDDTTRLCVERVDWLAPCGSGNGSPLFAFVDGQRRPLQIGLASAASACADQGPSSYVRLRDPEIRTFLARYVAL